ncbi:NAD(P)-dependent dehydrogenase (short-subunit alcohol dehydrogenase family) [Catenuloplanes nepalensis]|uniref:NAD(P)-dependent dehydrogenase (Short-subunit alcohol dehydrogenase family) n=1 Tax=Catenuloplanes nepalensis TaxID=587533 RepID=A0ABT9MTM2_9ACTN|nr:SDR family oxidoreductase [Catenuloplanes nepalensis]MDP9794734.1 NAD(P)-dependent dehydrogenase (short-subunit alcohol dehydrogenase family) [Catenuloplanes nepalensis]
MSDITIPRVVLVTGAASGFGRLTVEALAGRGHTVFAGIRNIEGKNRVAAEELDATRNVTVVELDVTDQDAATRAIDTIVATEGRIDVVVNNAGRVFAGPVEAFTAEEALQQYDLNVLGALRVNRAALPHLRRRGRGVMIQVSSTGARFTVPYTGLYTSSKAALSSLTETWRQELASFGIESVSVEPAPYETNLGVNGVMPADAARMEPYLPALGAFMTELAARQAEDDRDPRPVADALVRLVEAADGTRPYRTVVAPPAQAAAVEELYRAGDEAVRLIAADMGITAHMR